MPLPSCPFQKNSWALPIAFPINSPVNVILALTQNSTDIAPDLHCTPTLHRDTVHWHPASFPVCCTIVRSTPLSAHTVLSFIVPCSSTVVSKYVQSWTNEMWTWRYEPDTQNWKILFMPHYLYIWKGPFASFGTVIATEKSGLHGKKLRYLCVHFICPWLNTGFRSAQISCGWLSHCLGTKKPHRTELTPTSVDPEASVVLQEQQETNDPQNMHLSLSIFGQ